MDDLIIIANVGVGGLKLNKRQEQQNFVACKHFSSYFLEMQQVVKFRNWDLT